MGLTKIQKILFIILLIITVFIFGFYFGVGLIIGNHPAQIYFDIMNISLLVWGIYTSFVFGYFIFTS